MAKTKKVRTHKRGKTWSYIFEAGQINGKRKVVEKGGFATEKDAYNAGVEAYTDFMHGNIGITSESITLKDFMTNWLENVVALNVRVTTLQCYQKLFKHQVAPYLGGVKVQDLTPAMLDEWLRDLQKSGLSRSILLGVHALIHQALNYAVHPAQLISSNPVAYVKVPKNAPKNIVKRTIITPEQFQALLEKYPFGTPLYIPLLLLYHTGMRIGEIVGLSWSDIDFESKEIDVHRQMVYVRKRGNCLTSLKTESSKRYVIVDDFLLGELKRWQTQIAENEKALGDSYVYTYVESDGHLIKMSKIFPAHATEKISLICVRPNGKNFLKDNIASQLAKEGLNSHSFRHTHATQLIESGVALEEMSERLGGKNSDATFKVYVHNTSKVQEQFYKLQEETMSFLIKNLQTNIKE